MWSECLITATEDRISTLNIENKEQLKPARKGHQVVYKGRPIRAAEDLVTETSKARRARKVKFQVLKNSIANIDYSPRKLPVIIEKIVKTFHDKNRLKEFMTTKMIPEKMLERVFD